MALAKCSGLSSLNFPTWKQTPGPAPACRSMEWDHTRLVQPPAEDKTALSLFRAPLLPGSGNSGSGSGVTWWAFSMARIKESLHICVGSSVAALLCSWTKTPHSISLCSRLQGAGSRLNGALVALWAALSLSEADPAAPGGPRSRSLGAGRAVHKSRGYLPAASQPRGLVPAPGPRALPPGKPSPAPLWT